MKKTLLLFFALLTGVSGAWADEVLPTFTAIATPSISTTSGWYQLQWVDIYSDTGGTNYSDGDVNGLYVTNYATDITKGGKTYALYLDAAPTTLNQHAKTFVFLDNITTALNGSADVGRALNIRSANGHFISQDGSSSYTVPASQNYVIFVSSGNKTIATITSATSGASRVSLIPKDKDNTPYIGQSSANKYPGVKLSAVTPSDLGLQPWTVIVSGHSEDKKAAQITYNGENAYGLTTVYDGGTFFIATGTTPETSDFSATDVDGLNEEFTVNTVAKTITLTYTSSDRTYVSTLLGYVGVGYPASDATERTALQDAYDAGGTIGVELIDNYLSCTNIALPVSGQYYTITMVSKNGATNYPLVLDNGTFKPATSGTPVSFYCYQFTNKNGNTRYAFIAEDGKILGFKGLTTVYQTDYLENDFQVAPMITSTSGNINADAVRFGRVYITSDNRNETVKQDDKTRAYCYIISYSSTPSFDTSDKPYATSSYTSCISMGEGAAFGSTTARDLTIAKINAINEHYAHIGSDLGQYNRSSVLFANAEDYTAAINACETTEAVNTIRNAVVINQPATNAFYRIKGYSNNYITSNTTGTNASMNGTANANNIIYYNAEGNLIFYGSGYGLYNTHTVAPAGSSLNAYTFLQGAQIGKYYLKSNLNDGNGTYCYDNTAASPSKLDRNKEPVTSGSYQTDWSIESVTSLPITLNDGGDGKYYATLCLPRTVTISEGTSAYTLSISGSWAVPSDPIEGAIPAGTPVLLKGSSNRATLTIIGDSYASSPLTSTALTGTYAAIDISSTKGTDYYLGRYRASESDPYVVGFYHWNQSVLSGFRAYLTNATVNGSGVKGFAINWGDETGVESIEHSPLTIDHEAGTMFDLSGRRVNKAQKGLYIQNGKKVMVK